MSAEALGFAGVVLIAALATYVWRFMGVMLAARLDETSQILQWVRAVATALIAAMVVRMLLAPPGALAHTALLVRVAGIAAGALVYFTWGRRMGPAVAGAVITLLGMEYVRRFLM